MQTITLTANSSVLQEIKILISNFAKEKGEIVNIKDGLSTYGSIQELKADYAQRISDAKLKKEELSSLREGLDDMMAGIRKKYANKL